MGSLLAKGNRCFRAGEFERARAYYQDAIANVPELAVFVQFNIELAERRIANAHQSKLQQGETTVDRGQIFNAQEIPITLGGNANACIIEKQQIDWDEEEAQWVSSGTDPLFLLEPNRLFPTPGFYEWRVSISSDRDRDLSKFYFDTGSGFNELEVAGIQCERGEVLTRIIKIDNAPIAVRFDPREFPGGFEVDRFEIAPLDNQTAKMRMLEVVEENTVFRLTPELELWEEIKEEAFSKEITPVDLLYEKYVRTFNYCSQGLTYKEWIETVEKESQPTADEIQAALDGMAYKPLISIVMPVYNTPERFLRACIESVIAQSYPHWELCISDDNSSSPHVRTILQEYEHRDPRIRVVYRTENGHISRSSNSALEIALGDYVALLDHDDLLPEHSLYWVANTLNDTPDLRLIYSDEDKINEDGYRSDPYFKTDWNPDLFYSHNMFSHLGVYYRSLIDEVGGFRVGLEGSQDYDLALRCIERISDSQIYHIPRVLYHWRVHDESTAKTADAKPYAMLAGEKALNEHFDRTGVNGKVELIGFGYRARYALPENIPLVSIIIPTRNQYRLIRQCIDSIQKKTTYQHYEIIIVDNGSDDPESLEYFSKLSAIPNIRILRDDRPFNYSALNNNAVANARGEIIALINNDIEVITPEWLSEMVSHALRPEIGAVGAKLLYADNTVQHAGVILGVGGVAAHSHKHISDLNHGYFGRANLISAYSAVTAAAMVIKKSIFIKLGGFDEQHLSVAYNDVDFCLRVRELGYRNIYTPYAKLYHHESISRGHDDTPEKQARFLSEVEYMKEKWGDILLNDPFYNPNLTKDREDFSIGYSQ